MEFLFLADGSFLGATIDVVFYSLIAFFLATLFWYFWQKKDKEEIEKLKKTLDKVQPQHDVLQNQHEHLKSEHLKVKQGLADLMENYQALNTKHESVINNQSSTQNVYEQVDEERQSLLDSYESMETNYNALDEKYNSAVTTLDRLEEEIDSIKEERSELKLVNEHLRKEIKKLEVVLEENGEDVASLRTDIAVSSTAEEDELERLLGGAPAQNFVDTPVASDVNVVAATSNDQEEELKEIYAALKEDYNQLRSEHTQLNNDYQSLQNTHNQLIEEKETAIIVAPIADNKEEELKALKDEHSALQDDYVSVKDDLENRVLPQLRATQTLLNKKEEKYRALVAKMEAQSSKVQTSSSQLKSFEDIRATNQALYLGNKNLKEKNTDIEKRYEALNTKYNNLFSQFQLVRGQLGQEETQSEDIEQQQNSEEFKQLSKEYSELKINFLAAADEQKAQKARVAELESLIQSINDSTGYGIIYSPTDLKTIEGIDKKIEPLLKKANIQNWNDLAKTNADNLEAIIKDGGKRFEGYDPQSWSEQAQLLVAGKWKAFRDLEANLISGKKIKAKTKDFDDLKVIEGIGPKIEVLLNNSNIYTWKKLSKTGIGELKKILKAAGSKYQVHDPSSWPEQAALAATWNWTQLEDLQADLKGGRASQ